MKNHGLQKATKRKRKRKRSRANSSLSSSANMHALIFPQILASLANVHTKFARSLLLKHLNNLHKSLSSKTLTLSDSTLFLSLLPPLLQTTKSTPSVVQRTADIIGAISLQSFQSNKEIASDEEILKALLNALMSRSKSVARAACNAVMDLSTTLVGREKLCELNAVEKLMMEPCLQSMLLYAIWGREAVLVSTCHGGEITEDAFRVLILDATVALINTCNVKQLSKIPEGLSKIVLTYLRGLLVPLQDQSSLGVIAKCSEEKLYCLSAKKEDLRESIFRLSMNSHHFTTSGIFDKVKRNIFGPRQSDFEHFIFKYWENAPVLLKKHPEPLDNHDILSSLVQSFNSKHIQDVLQNLLEGLVCCPPLPSDELNIVNFLKELKIGLGQPIMYGQDIRLVKAVDGILDTNRGSLKREVHFLNDCTGSSCIRGPDLINMCDLQKYEEAYREGYTIAMRGMEFRSENISSIATELSFLFGQPSIGANAYLTPPRSQGLVRHYDDHCVFICQLLGKKHWTVLPRSTLHLPRLYEPLDHAVGSEVDIAESECKQFLLGEGDILYIPRGCWHEACTKAENGGSEMDDASTGFSFHLTLGIEIEPPFEWEGFAHVALHCWDQNKKLKQYTLLGPFQKTMNFVSINLLHVAIQQIGALDPTFAKACMVIAFFSPSDTRDRLQTDTLWQSQKTTFSYVVSKIYRDAGFLEAIKSVEEAVQKKNEDVFQRMRWIIHLYPEDNTMEQLDWDKPLIEFKNILLLLNEHREAAEAAFMQVKSNFCREVAIEDVCESFVLLHQKYKKVRTQYMNGMLSLHSSGKF